MEYNVFSKKRDSTVANADLRSGTGDMHAHRNALMMKSHVEMLLKHDMLDPVMAVNLAKPLDKEWKYTEAYLKTHPEYTGVQPEMTTLSTAEKNQKKRDREMEKFVKDYEEGRIDENGKPFREGSGSGSGDTNEDNESSSVSSEEEEEEEEDHNDTSHPPSSSSPEGPTPLPVPAPSSSPYHFSPPTSSPASKAPAAAPLQPLPGYPDYAQYKYYTLLAICRERTIRSPGGTQEVRNLLIRDDINVARELPRDIAVWKKGNREVYKHGADRKTYKHGVPEGMKGKVVSGKRVKKTVTRKMEMEEKGMEEKGKS
jgi:hypothetical protein